MSPYNYYAGIETGVFYLRTIHFPTEIVSPSQLYKDVNQFTHD